ncbi:MAG: GNAT family N-acetyltransferase [Candidatus Bathyarchaeia archaeon]|jgi:acetyltransferase
MVTRNLDKIFNPKSVAIIGASDVEGSVGYVLAKNFTQLGYVGKVYFVNIRKPEIFGVKTYKCVDQISEPIDLAIIATPAKTVQEVMEECGKAHVKGVIIVSAGFKEIGPEGKALEKALLEIAKKYDIRVIGPNCIGVIRPRINLNATFLDTMPKPGNIAFLSQSGALGSPILDWAIHENIGLSNFVSVGSMIDVDFGDLIDYFGSDPKTKSIIMYVEGITDARKFMSAARHFSRTKPIIVVKAGKFAESAKAAASHTGSVSGDDEIYDAAFKRAGIVRVEDINDLFNAAQVLGTQPLPKGPKLAIITNAGGAGVMATDALIARGGKLARLSDRTMSMLNNVLPSFWSKGNPIDVVGDAKADCYKVAVEACLDDDTVDGILLIFTQQAGSEPAEIAKCIVDLVNSKAYKNKTILTSFMGFEGVLHANKIFNANNIPTYSTPEQATKTYMYMYNYQRNLELLYETPEELPVDASPPKRPIMAIIRNAAFENREVLTEEEAKNILKYYNFPILKSVVASNVDEAVLLAKEMGFPVVLKILSPQIVNKKVAGGVILNVNSPGEVREAYQILIQRAISYNPNAQITGVTVQHMVEQKAYEILLGGKTDPVFGPVILFGMGGAGLDFYKDYSIGLPPLNITLIRRMMEETKVYQLLKGYYNTPPMDIKKLSETILLLSKLLIDFPQIKEIDINPLLVSEKEVCIIDARIAINKDDVCKKFEPHAHMVISPYPKKYEMTWSLKNGQEVILRPIKPEDEPLWLAMFQGFSEDSIRYRFFQILKDTPHEVRVRYCNIDYDREVAIVAEIVKSGQRKILGVARVSIEPDGKSGEIAFIVSDNWQGLGLGTKMVDYVLEISKEKGVADIYAIVLPDNSRALSLLKKMGFNLEYLGDGTVRGSLNLKNEDLDNRCNEQPKISEKIEAEHLTLTAEKTNEEKSKAVTADSPI